MHNGARKTFRYQAIAALIVAALGLGLFGQLAQADQARMANAMMVTMVGADHQHALGLDLEGQKPVAMVASICMTGCGHANASCKSPLCSGDYFAAIGLVGHPPQERSSFRANNAWPLAGLGTEIIPPPPKSSL